MHRYVSWCAKSSAFSLPSTGIPVRKYVNYHSLRYLHFIGDWTEFFAVEPFGSFRYFWINSVPNSHDSSIFSFSLALIIVNMDDLVIGFVRHFIAVNCSHCKTADASVLPIHTSPIRHADFAVMLHVHDAMIKKSLAIIPIVDHLNWISKTFEWKQMQSNCY